MAMYAGIHLGKMAKHPPNNPALIKKYCLLILDYQSQCSFTKEDFEPAPVKYLIHPEELDINTF